MPIRDDSAGNYGQWDSSDLSWLDFIKATGSDVGNGAYNALSNITGALSPIGTSPEGNMSLQVPPMITGIADSYRRLSDPTGPGNAYRLTGVPELDAPIQQDMSNVLLSFTGGQAIGGLGRAALPKRGMNRIERTVTDYDFPMYRMTDNAGTEIARAQFDELPNAVRVKDLFVDPSHRGQGVASTLYGHIQDDLGKPMTPDYTLTPDGFEFWKNSYPEAVADYRFDGQTYRQPGPLRAGAETGAVESYRMSGGPNRDSNVLWSDTGKPSIFGSALATAGEQQPARAYRGVSRDQFAGAADQPVWLSSSPDVASSYAGSYPFDPSPSVYPADLEFRNPMTFDAQGGGWGELNVGGKYMDSDELAALARSRGHDGLIMKNVVDGPDGVGVPQATTYAALRRNTVRSPLTGETLFSDTGRPSIFGSALATAGEQPRGQPMRGYRGARTDEGQFQPGDTYWATSNPEIANTFALQNEWPRQTVPNVSPVDVNFANPLVIDSPTPYDWAAVPFDGGTTMTNSVADAARLRGHDGVIFNNIMEGTGDLPATTYAALRPNTVRSATTGETLFSDTGKPSIFGAAAATAGEQPRGITAYHGSPHDFDKFSLDKIGTGEGAQAYGHGLYFAENEGVAGAYKKQLTDRTNFVRPDGSLWSADGLEHMNVRAMAYRGDIDGAIAKARVIAAEDSPVAGHARRDLEKLLSLQASGGVKPNPGRMYEVRINADPEDFLDWDKPLSQQSGVARDAINRVGRDVEPYGLDKITDDLRPLEMNKFLQDPAAVSRLREHGVPGIRYLDGNSRGAGAGSSNYVVFDDSLIEILKKYGMAAGAVGAGALAQPDAANAQEIPDWLKF